MDYSQIFFGKPIANLLYKDIIDYFATAKEENDKIEFKSFSAQGSLDDKFKGIYKSCCAFLNSEGGIIIWGAPAGVRPSDRKEKIYQGALTPINTILEKDNVINRVSNNLTPIPNGINVNIIQDTTDANCICVFEVQKSEYAPHQWEDIYYMRLDGQSRHAPHHYIEALFKQIKYPNLEGYLKFNSILPYSPANTSIDVFSDAVSYVIRLNLEIMIFNFSSMQNETNVSFRLTCDKGKFYLSSLSIVASHNEYSLNGHQFVQEKFADILHFGAPKRISTDIYFNPHENRRTNSRAKLILHFGGEHSPLKQSDYLISTTPRNIGVGQDINNMILEKNENRLMSDLQIDIGVTKAQQLREALGR